MHANSDWRTSASRSPNEIAAKSCGLRTISRRNGPTIPTSRGCAKRSQACSPDCRGSAAGDDRNCHPEPPEASQPKAKRRRTVEGPPACLHRESPPPSVSKKGGPSTVLRRSALRAPAPPAAKDDSRYNPRPMFDALTFAKRLIDIPSPTENEFDVAVFLHDELAALGYACRRH